MLEKMDEFFACRLDGYDAHMLQNIAGAKEFYPFTAQSLPRDAQRVLDLGCGTGLELQWYFEINPAAQVTGIDLSGEMLAALQRKFFGRALTLIQDSYFTVPLGENAFDAAVSVESLHHFTKAEKLPLYAKLHRALNPGGVFILTDYFALSNEEEQAFRAEYLALKKEQGIEDDAMYHFDTPLTVEHELQALREGGFTSVTVLRQWGATHTIKAVK